MGSRQINAQFIAPTTWEAVEALVVFQPSVPSWTAGFELHGLRIYTRDHDDREIPKSARTLEAHYGGFVLSELETTPELAKRSALEVSYGAGGQTAWVSGHEGRSYEPGPEPHAGDPDDRMPALVTWADGRMFYLVASSELSLQTLMRIASSMYVAQ